MPQKTCPKCQSKCASAKKICTNCKFEFPFKDRSDRPVKLEEEETPDDENELDDYPQRTCRICKTIYYPSIVNTSSSGNPKFVWHYNYCSEQCLAKAEEVLFSYLYGISELPDPIKQIVNESAFNERKEDKNSDYLTFTENSNLPYSSTVQCPENFTRVKLENFYPEKSLERQTSNLLDLPLGDYLENVLNEPEIAKQVKRELKPRRGEKKCPGCDAVLPSKKYVCDICEYDFRKG